ncbi:MAG TPA: hypothetical protein VKB09_00450, partial [Thermomicrobiales bacterium]|nr:hypothetical protein [Thermomicrobiales bacterium]
LRRVPIDARPGFVLASPVASTPAPPPSASLAARLLGLSDPLPPGIAVSDLGSGHTTSLSQGPVRIILERLSVAGGADLAARPVSGATTLLLVEAGTLTLIDELGLEAVATEGAYQLIPPTGDFELRNEGASTATVLRLSILSQDAAPLATDEASATILLDGDLTDLPASPASIFLARIVMTPGADLGSREWAGPVGVVAEAGTLTVERPERLPAELPAGRGVLFPAATTSRWRNTGTEPVALLIVGVAASPGESASEPASATVQPTVVSTCPTSPRSEPTPRPSSLRAPDFLPDPADLPDGFEVAAEGKLTKDEMIALIGENGTELLAEWEWRENAYRYFAIPEALAPDPLGTSNLTVSVHRFRTRNGATAALAALVSLTAASGYETVDIDQIGDQAAALLSQTADGNTFILYVRIENLVIRLGGFSAAGDPAADVTSVANTIVGASPSVRDSCATGRSR